MLMVEIKTLKKDLRVWLYKFLCSNFPFCHQDTRSTWEACIEGHGCVLGMKICIHALGNLADQSVFFEAFLAFASFPVELKYR